MRPNPKANEFSQTGGSTFRFCHLPIGDTPLRPARLRSVAKFAPFGCQAVKRISRYIAGSGSKNGQIVAGDALHCENEIWPKNGRWCLEARPDFACQNPLQAGQRGQ